MYDEFLQQHRRAVSKLDLEERRRREAREKGKWLNYWLELMNIVSIEYLQSKTAADIMLSNTF